MSTQARAFRKRSTQLRRKMWWKNVKVMILIGFSGLVSPSTFRSRSQEFEPLIGQNVSQLLVYFIIASFCGLGLSCGGGGGSLL